MIRSMIAVVFTYNRHNDRHIENMTNNAKRLDRKQVKIQIDERHLCRADKYLVPYLVDVEVLYMSERCL